MQSLKKCHVSNSDTSLGALPTPTRLKACAPPRNCALTAPKDIHSASITNQAMCEYSRGNK
eukprot:3704344-Amphidinium_carterae.1